MKIWVVICESESGDRGGKVFEEEPTKEQLKRLAHDFDGEDYDDGPGYNGSYTHIEVHELDTKNRTIFSF